MIDFPAPFQEAIRFILDKEPTPEEWDASEWSQKERDVRIKAFFSALVENARFLDRAQGLLFDFLAGTTEEVTGPDGVTRTALRIGDRATFVRRIREFMVAEGMVTPEEFDTVNQGDLTDIRSEERLRLIFDTNIRQAYGYGHYEQGMRPAVLRRYPAARFIREEEVAEPRPRHAEHEGEVRLKTDEAWWAAYQNDPEIGGFGVPWGPYGFRSGMGQEDVSREEAIRLGLPVEKITATPVEKRNLNEGLSASIKQMDPEIKQRLLDELRSGPKGRTPEEAARDAAARARARAQARREGRDEPQFHEDGDRIRFD